MALASLDRVGLRDKANQRPNQLSGGQRQRVTIARALVNNPSIMWADEPTGALDSSTANEIMDLIVDLNRQAGQTCVLVTHDPKVAARCHRTIHMADGVIAPAFDTPASRHGTSVPAARRQIFADNPWDNSSRSFTALSTIGSSTFCAKRAAILALSASSSAQ